MESPKLKEAQTGLNNHSNRNYGLDILRGIAIIFVMIGHTTVLLPKYIKPWYQLIQLDGVAFFFVLSGFLIGGILIRQMAKEPFTFQKAKKFLIRRWFRTLPNYFTVLLFLVIFSYFFDSKKYNGFDWTYLFFLQNMNQGTRGFFGESWSLAVEEYFYLFLAIVVVLFSIAFRNKLASTFKTVTITTISLVILLRIYLYADSTVISKDIPFFTFCRFDAIMTGVLGAWIYFSRDRISKISSLLLFLLGFGVLILLKLTAFLSDYLAIVYYPFLRSVAVLLMFPYFLSWDYRNTWVERFLVYTGKISYSLYLINLSVIIYIVIRFIINGNLDSTNFETAYWPILIPIYWIFSYLLARLMYYKIEVPFLKIRDRFVPD